jgi:hypothetical protein
LNIQPAAEYVAEPPAGDQEDRQRERVAIHSPLKLADARPQVALD